MGKDPAFLFYPGDYLGGTLGMSFEEKGAYIDLLIMQFNRGHMAEHMIRHMVGDLWDHIKDKFKIDDAGLYYNERLEVEKDKRSSYTAGRRDNLYGKKQYLKDSHMTEHMENRNRNENEVKKVIDLFNKICGTKFKHTPANIKHIGARMKEGHSFKDCKVVITRKYNQWKADPEMSKYIRIETFFRPSKFESYLNEKDVKKPKPESQVNFKALEGEIAKYFKRIATDDMIEKFLMDIPQKAWWMVDKFLKKRFPDGGTQAFGRVESKIMRGGFVQ